MVLILIFLYFESCFIPTSSAIATTSNPSMAFGSTSHEQLDHLDEVNEGVSVANFEILQHGFLEVDEKEQDEVNGGVNFAIDFEILQHGFHKVDEKEQKIMAQGGEWYFHDVEKWVQNLFDEWRRLKSYPTNINIMY
jgi:hypothetical protein